MPESIIFISLRRYALIQALDVVCQYESVATNRSIWIQGSMHLEVRWVYHDVLIRIVQLSSGGDIVDL